MRGIGLFLMLTVAAIPMLGCSSESGPASEVASQDELARFVAENPDSTDTSAVAEGGE